MKKILISGGLGFIAGHLIEYLLKNYDYEIINVDSLEYCANLKLDSSLKEKFKGRYFPYYHKIQNLRDMKIIIGATKPDLIINAAAQSHVDNSIKNSLPFIDSNVNGVWSLLECCRIFKLPGIFFSTDEVLSHKILSWHNGNGDASNMSGGIYTIPLFDRVTEENAQFNPSSPYSASKASGEMLCNSYKKTYGLDIKIVRPTNIYGPRQYKEKLIPKTISLLKQDKKVPIYGGGNQYRDWLYVDDFIWAFDLIMHKGKKDIYHVARNDERQNIDIVKMILQSLKKPESLLEFVEDRLGHDVSYSLSYKRLKEELGWVPIIQFEKGLEEIIKGE